MKYDFFKDIKNYMTYNKLIETTDVNTINDNKCDFNEEDFSLETIDFAKNLCKKFKFLYQNIDEDPYRAFSESTKNFAYTNYWLNIELNKKGTNNILAKDFYNKIKRKDADFDKNNLENIINDIDESELNNMKILDALYTNYYEIGNVSVKPSPEGKSCLHYSQICVDEYEKIIINCPDNEETPLCNILEDYREIYEGLQGFISSLGNCKSADLIELPDYNAAIKKKQMIRVNSDLGSHETHSSDGNSGITIITVIGIILGIFSFLYLLYMFTPFGTWLRPRIQRHIKIFKFFENHRDRNLGTNYENDDTNSNIESYNIGYRSFQNL
ncbi:PIR Superfamily Protein [Plasmodium ovale wallikeri]|uniref:PIR Superfamily Protein n=1 Tax=Plasmodium ovale wallikeri TaxID=864142 RepID=A0A1A8YHD2_PLAOA|nr:PIR Superfamily Protein [Plasmodium ovale wallikeri]SBT31552.1 PIR Superfamily Protein [Plasmodium ovale wallikeri]